MPHREFEAHQRAFEEAKAQSEHILADHAAARQVRSNLVAMGSQKTNPAPNARLLSNRLGLDKVDDGPGLNDIEVRLRVWGVIAAYNNALASIASGAKSSEIEGSVNGFLGTLQKFPVKEIAKMAAEVAPYAGVLTELVGVIQREVEARRFRQGVLKAEQPMKEFIALLRGDAVLFRNYRVALFNATFAQQQIYVFDRVERFKIVSSAHGWDRANEVNALARQINANRILAAGVETFPEIPLVAVAPPPPPAPHQEAEMVELRMLADAIEREAAAARATVTELTAYHELMRQSLLLIDELTRTHSELAQAARTNTRRLPTVDQLNRIISNVRMAHQIYTTSK